MAAEIVIAPVIRDTTVTVASRILRSRLFIKVTSSFVDFCPAREQSKIEQSNFNLKQVKSQ